MEIEISFRNETVVSDRTLLARFSGGNANAERNMDEFLAGLDVLPYLNIQPAKTATWPGHPTLIAKIDSGSWTTDPLLDTKDGRLVFPDPARHFDVHFELQVLKWKQRMALYLHYETAPYYSEAKLRARADRACVEQYYQRRSEFIQEFIALEAVPGFKISPGTVQIGKAGYDFNGKTAEEVAAWITPIIDEVACAVNLALFRVDQRRALRAILDEVEAEASNQTTDGTIAVPAELDRMTV